MPLSLPLLPYIMSESVNHFTVVYVYKNAQTYVILLVSDQTR